jgi:hypothetical protein
MFQIEILKFDPKFMAQCTLKIKRGSLKSFPHLTQNLLVDASCAYNIAAPRTYQHAVCVATATCLISV